MTPEVPEAPGMDHPDAPPRPPKGDAKAHKEKTRRAKIRRFVALSKWNQRLYIKKHGRGPR